MRDKCRGSLVGGAVGDALGYEVEFMGLPFIRKRFGDKGITRYVLDEGGVARFSDDTQMSLFTLEGLMSGVAGTGGGKPDEILPYIEKSYIHWYKTQTETPQTHPGSWLSGIRSLWARRAPGMTCMGALGRVAQGREALNNSKGCGGVMRVAPIGIFNAAHPQICSLEDTARLAGRAAEVTHKHIASTFASALHAVTVENCVRTEAVGRPEFSRIVDGGLSMMQECFPGHDEELKKFCGLIKRAITLGEDDVHEEEAIRELGEGWVGDEAVAIAVFSVMRHVDSFEDCVVCAVNHDGDSDSTGAVAGNIIGAILGYSAIPDYYRDSLEIGSVLVSAADDLCADINDREASQRIRDRYVKHVPAGVEDEYLF